MKKLAALLICFGVVLALLPVQEAKAATYDQTPLRIGLAYNMDAVPAAKFINDRGNSTYGNSFGYFDDARNFYNLFSTEERKIAILKNRPMWMKVVSAADDKYDYFDQQPSDYTYSIGCYHLEASQGYTSYTEVMDAVAWVNSLGLKAFPAYVGGGYRLRIGEHLSTDRAQAAMSEAQNATGYSLSVVGESRTAYTVTILGTDRILFQLDMGGSGLGMMPLGESTWFQSYQYLGGFDMSRLNGNDMTVVNVVSMNDYIKGVVPYEVSPVWPIEAQKVQAVAAKCYAVGCLEQRKHRSMGFDMCPTTDCQVYHGISRATELSNRAVEETYGIYATYGGEIIQAYYHSTSGGYTEDVENIWNHQIPYLRAVEDKYLVIRNPYSFTINLSDVTKILQAKGRTSRSITDLYVSRYSAVGNAIELAAVEQGGNILRFKGDEARTILNSSLTASNMKVNSHRYTVSGGATFSINGQSTSRSVQSTYAIGGDGLAQQVAVSNDNLRVLTAGGVESMKLESSSSGVYTISGTGAGHNIGMSQWGAHAMAELGYTYDQILSFYYTGITVGYIN